MFFACLYIAHTTDGSIESKVMPRDETKMVMGVSDVPSVTLTLKIFDLVREQNGHRFAEGMEQVQ
jgi:hypothetical protein